MFLLSLPAILAAWFFHEWPTPRRWPWHVLEFVFFMGSVPLGLKLGHSLSHLDFHLRRRAIYQATVDRILDGTIPTTDGAGSIPVATTYGAQFNRFGNNGLRVEFLWGRGFPTKHTIYIYTSTGRPGDGAWGSWRWYKRLDDHWFEAAD